MLRLRPAASAAVALASLHFVAGCGGPPRAEGPAAPAAAPAPSPVAPSIPSAPGGAPSVRFRVTFPKSLEGSNVDGRLLVILAHAGDKEPRFQVSDRDGSAEVAGVDVDGWKPDAPVFVDGSATSYPLRSLAELPAGDYVVQALLHRYETFVRGDGRTLKLPPDRGEGQSWRKAPGNLLSAPRTVHVSPGAEIPLALDRVTPPFPETKDTPYIKYVRFESPLLTKFWGRPTFLGAIVHLPEGWATHPRAHYPLVIEHGHFTREPFGWRETPPDPSLPKADLAALRVHCPNGHEGDACEKYGYPRLQQELSYAFYKEWTGPKFPRVIRVEIQHANPFYDDSYAVNSANVGPYGDAITNELVPYLERTFRGLGPWARALYGGSTGGWESLAAQVFYPDAYNGAVANCPDPIDFRAYTVVNLYQDENAYYTSGPFRRTARPAERDYLGAVRGTIEQHNQMELAIGGHSRSGGQWDIWEAVFSPVGADGYPARIWDKVTGVIDPKVAAYWRDHYDLGHILERDWARIGPKLRGKITINVGLADNFFLNDAVYLVEDFLKKASPAAEAVVDYGPRDEHCWSGDPSTFNGVSRLTMNGRILRKFAERFTKTAPPGADVRSWKY